MPSPNLMDEVVLGRDPDLGACTSTIVGRLGVGKTSLLSDIAIQLQKLKEKDESRPQDEKIFWRGQESCQFLKFHGEVDYKVLVPEIMNLEFISEDGLHIKQHKFATFPELYEKAESDKINVIYCTFDEIADFMEWLQKTRFSWNSIFVDEVEDLAPQGVGGQQFKENRRVSNLLKESRKYRLSFYSTTQAIQDIDWRVRKKLMICIYLQGSTPRGGSPLWTKSIQALNVGEAWVCDRGGYEKINFPPHVTKSDVKARPIRTGERIPTPEVLQEDETEIEETEEEKTEDKDFDLEI